MKTATKTFGVGLIAAGLMAAGVYLFGFYANPNTEYGKKVQEKAEVETRIKIDQNRTRTLHKLNDDKFRKISLQMFPDIDTKLSGADQQGCEKVYIDFDGDKKVDLYFETLVGSYGPSISFRKYFIGTLGRNGSEGKNASLLNYPYNITPVPSPERTMTPDEEKRIDLEYKILTELQFSEENFGNDALDLSKIQNK